MTEHHGRSPQQIVDDEHIHESDELGSMLRQWINGGYLFVGTQREALKSMEQRVDQYILGEGPPIEHLARKICMLLHR